MSDSTWEDDADPTAVRHMKELLDEYEENASKKLAALRERIRRNTPLPPPEESPGQVPATKQTAFIDAPTKRTRKRA